MTHTKANKSKILTLILGLATCFVLMLVIVLANPTFAAYAAGEDGTAPTIIRTGGLTSIEKTIWALSLMH